MIKEQEEDEKEEEEDHRRRRSAAVAGPEFTDAIKLCFLRFTLFHQKTLSPF